MPSQPGPPGYPPHPAVGQFDPLAAGDAVPSWPELRGMPPIGPAVTQPKLGPRILVPVGAALLLAVTFLLVPWSKSGDGFFTVVSFFADQGVRDLGDFYVLCFAGPMGLTGLLTGFAAGTDLKPVKLAQLGIGVLAIGAGGLVAFAQPAGYLPYLMGFAVVNLLWVVAIGLTKRIGVRIAAAAYLGACALLHVAVLATWQAPWLSGAAYLPVLGYLVGAAGAAIGPRYVQGYAEL